MFDDVCLLLVVLPNVADDYRQSKVCVALLAVHAVDLHPLKMAGTAGAVSLGICPAMVMADQLHRDRRCFMAVSPLEDTIEDH